MGFLSRLFSRGVGEGTDALRATATEPLSPAQRAEYLRLLEIFNTNRIDYNTRKWETIKFAESAFTVLFGAAIVGVYTKLDVLSSSWLLKILFATLCFLAFLSAILGAVNLARESVLLYVEEGSAFKLAHLLELDRDVGPRPWLRGDQRLLPQKWREPGACNKTIEEWASRKVWSHRFFRRTLGLFLVEALAALVVIAIVFLYQSSPNVGMPCYRTQTRQL